MSAVPGTAYAELQVATNFSFLRGASHPQELAFTAASLGLAGMGVTDRNTLAGVVRAWAAAREVGLPFRVGCRLDFADGRPSVLCYPTDREAYGRLSRLLTLGKMRAEKGDCELSWADLYDHADGQVLIVVPPAAPDEGFERDLTALAGDFRRHVYLAASRPYGARDAKRLHRLAALARDARAPMVATNDVLYHDPFRRPLQDVLTCIREKTTVQQAGLRLEANAERHLKRPEEMARLFSAFPDALARTIEIIDRLDFDLGQLKYEYPHEPTPPGRTHDDWLAELAWKGAQWRYPAGIPPKVAGLLEKELAFVKAKGLPQYFLTVHDVVRFARDRGILCQGRGSAANSVICYCLGVTAVDPTFVDLLFERFLSEGRDEPPDIDVDFEHERREEVIQYVYGRYGRDRAAICATVIHYRPRSAVREVGKALGLTEDVTARLADTVWGSWGDGVPDAHVVQAGFDPDNPEISRAVELATELLGFPRHLSQHVGGFILTERPLSETVPIGAAAMEERTFIEWDKDDVEALGLMKVDVLALGMLTALKRGFDMLSQDKGVFLPDIAAVPKEDPAVYDMLCKADSVGVFQVESRAQMSMLPRLKPRAFYDLVIQVAIVRPGPIQGDMVHPYLRRRAGIDPVEFPSPSPEHGPPDELVQVLGKTLGVPLFQEQAMRLAIEAARFSPSEANGLRRCMATFKSLGDLGVHRDKFVGGMVRRGYDRDFAERCFKQIEGFGSYGFPESHAASFANLVYASAWVKRRHPDVFCAALLNSQPMGFYAPAQLVRDAREHGVEVRGPDVMRSGWDCGLEREGAAPKPVNPLIPESAQRLSGTQQARPERCEARPATSVALAGSRLSRPLARASGRDDGPEESASPELLPVRLGLRQVRGLKREDAERLVAARVAGAASPEAFAAAGVPRKALELLAEADAFRSLGMDRRQALWAVKGLEAPGAPLALAGARAESQPMLPLMALPEQVVEDYRTTRLSLKAHPVGFFREALAARGVVPARALRGMRDGRRAAVAGLVLVRQRPGTAKGVTFLTLEDETGAANVVVWRDRFEAHRKTVMTAAFLLVRGRLQVEGEVIHLVAEDFVDLSPRLRRLRQDGSGDPAAGMKSRDFH